MKEFNIDFEYAINNDIISIADVLENIEKMKREQILEQHGDLIKQNGISVYQINHLKTVVFAVEAKTENILKTNFVITS